MGGRKNNLNDVKSYWRDAFSKVYNGSIFLSSQWISHKSHHFCDCQCMMWHKETKSYLFLSMVNPNSTSTFVALDKLSVSRRSYARLFSNFLVPFATISRFYPSFSVKFRKCSVKINQARKGLLTTNKSSSMIQWISTSFCFSCRVN